MDTDTFSDTTPALHSDSSNITYTNDSLAPAFDVDAHLLQYLGPKRLPLNWLIPLTVVYSIIFLTGIVGNICTCLVIARNQYMQTATNCYLFNLAIADMMTLLFGEYMLMISKILLLFNSLNLVKIVPCLVKILSCLVKILSCLGKIMSCFCLQN